MAAGVVYIGWEYYNFKNPEEFSLTERAKWNRDVLREEANLKALREGREKQKEIDHVQQESERLASMMQEMKQQKQQEQQPQQA